MEFILEDVLEALKFATEPTLEAIALTDDDYVKRMIAIGALANQETLEQIARNAHECWLVRCEAIKKLEDPNVLMEIVMTANVWPLNAIASRRRSMLEAPENITEDVDETKKKIELVQTLNDSMDLLAILFLERNRFVRIAAAQLLYNKDIPPNFNFEIYKRRKFSYLKQYAIA